MPDELFAQLKTSLAKYRNVAPIYAMKQYYYYCRKTMDIKKFKAIIICGDNIGLYNALEEEFGHYIQLHITNPDIYNWITKQGLPVLQIFSLCELKPAIDAMESGLAYRTTWNVRPNQRLYYVEWTKENMELHYFYYDALCMFMDVLPEVYLLESHENNLQLLMSDTMPDDDEEKIKTWLVIGGYGDLLIMMPFYLALQDMEAKKNKKVRFLVNTKVAYDLIHMFIPDAMINISPKEISRNIPYKLLFPIIEKQKHYAAVLQEKYLQQIFSGDMLVNSYFELLCQDTKELTGADSALQLLKQFDSKKPNIKVLAFDKTNYKYWIAFQGSSSTVNAKGEKAKEIPVDLIKYFINRCHQHSIGVINLDRETDMKDSFDLDLSNLDIAEILTLLPNTNAFVGIDSCFGHGCALLNIPSITISISNEEFYKILGMSFRPMRNNYTFIPLQSVLKNSDMDRIMNVLMKILSRERLLHTSYVPVADTLENIHYEFL